MNPDPSKLRQQQQEQAQEAADLQLAHQTQAAREFNSVEEIIRFDSEHNPVPPIIATRVQESIAREPLRARSWWQRLFGRKP